MRRSRKGENGKQHTVRGQASLLAASRKELRNHARLPHFRHAKKACEEQTGKRKGEIGGEGKYKRKNLEYRVVVPTGKRRPATLPHQ